MFWEHTRNIREALKNNSKTSDIVQTGEGLEVRGQMYEPPFMFFGISPNLIKLPMF